MPKISVVIPSYNHGKFIAKAIQSVLDQTFQDFELLICDDASTDNSVAIIQQFVDRRIRLQVNERNMGASYTHNWMITQAAGEYIALLNSDDIWLPQKLAIQLDFLESNLQYAAVFSYAQIINESGEPSITPTSYTKVFEQPNRNRSEWLRHFYYYGNCLCHPSSLIRKTVYSNVGLYNKLMSSLTDLEMWIRVCLKYDIYILPNYLVQFRALDSAQNASGQNTANIIRGTFENGKLLNTFCLMDDINTFSQMFPDQKIDNIKMIPLRFAEIALTDSRRELQISGITKLYELLIANYDYYSQFVDATMFSKISTKYDIFNLFNLQNAFVELYYDVGGGFDNKHYIQQRILVTQKVYEFDLIEIKSLKALRLDPMNAPSKVELKLARIITNSYQELDLVISSHNADSVNDHCFLFYHDDPTIIFSLPTDQKIIKFVVDFNITAISTAEQITYWQKQKVFLKEQDLQLQQVKQKLTLFQENENMYLAKIDLLNKELASKNWRYQFRKLRRFLKNIVKRRVHLH